MTNRTAFLVFVLAAGLAGCDDGAPAPGPTAPPSVATPPTYPPAGYSLSHVTLSGGVFEETMNGRVPIDAVAVYCEFCSAETHAWASTDSNGLFSFTAVWTNPSRFPTSIWIGRDGYADPEGLPRVTPGNAAGQGWREVVVDGDTRMEVQLVRK